MNDQETGENQSIEKEKERERERETTLTSICIAILYHNKYLLFLTGLLCFVVSMGYMDNWQYDPLCIIPDPWVQTQETDLEHNWFLFSACIWWLRENSP